MRRTITGLAVLVSGWLILADSAWAASLVVVEARAAGFRPGMRVDSAASLRLQEGERIVLIAPDGRAVTVRGRYSGQVMSGAATTQNPRAALAALLTTRRDRASTIGAVRSGAAAAPLPDPWLIDMSRPGERCIREGERPIWWRPQDDLPQSFTVYPLDRTWRADFAWLAGTSTMAAPDLAMLASTRSFVVRRDNRDQAIRLHVIPTDVEDPVVLAAWMLQKGCIQQADAYLRRLEAGIAPGDHGGMAAPDADRSRGWP